MVYEAHSNSDLLGCFEDCSATSAWFFFPWSENHNGHHKNQKLSKNPHWSLPLQKSASQAHINPQVSVNSHQK